MGEQWRKWQTDKERKMSNSDSNVTQCIMNVLAEKCAALFNSYEWHRDLHKTEVSLMCYAHDVI